MSGPDSKPETEVGRGRIPPKDGLEELEESKLLALGLPREGVVTLSQIERNLPTTANVDARDFKHLACWLIVQIGPISLNVTTP